MSKRKLLIIFIVLIAAAGAAYYYSAQEQSKGPQFRETQVRRGSLSTTILSTGVVKPENRVEVKPPIAGRAEQVLVREGAKVRKGQTLVIMSSTERAALLDAARARGAEELKKWEEMYRATPILAPVGGTIISRTIEPGQTFAVTDPILVMSDRLIVEAQVDETDLANVKIGQKAKIILDAYPEKPISAEVGSIAFEATTVNNVTTYVVKVIAAEVPEQMRSGMTANVRFEIESREDVLLVDSEAIKVEAGKFVVLKKTNTEGKPLASIVSTGLTDGKLTEVTSGVAEGETLLIQDARIEAAPAQGSNPFAPSRPNRRR